MRKVFKKFSVSCIISSAIGFSADNNDLKAEAAKKSIELLNVSYDPTKSYMKHIINHLQLIGKNKTGQRYNS